MTAIVLDKCFLQAARWERVRDLAEAHELIVTGSLFHELLSGDSEARRRVFAKLPRKDDPVRLIDNVSAFLKHEESTRTPAEHVLSHALAFSFRFHPELGNAGYTLTADVRDAVDANVAKTTSMVEDYVRRTNAVVDMFHPLSQGSDQSRADALQRVEAEIADVKNVLVFYGAIGDPDLPPPDLVDERWATVRFFQTALLFSAHTIHRLKGPIGDAISPSEFERLEHDVHDHMVLCVGVMAGGLATNEIKLKRWFKMLSPNGLLVST